MPARQIPEYSLPTPIRNRNRPIERAVGPSSPFEHAVGDPQINCCGSAIRDPRTRKAMSELIDSATRRGC